MNATVKFRESTLKQTGTVGKILMYMQDHPEACKNTFMKDLGHVTAIAIGVKDGKVFGMYRSMFNNQFIIRHGTRSPRARKTFSINYWHKDMPGYIIERAPQEVRDEIEKMKAKLTGDQYIDNDGCIVTPGKKHEPYDELKARIEQSTEQPEKECEEPAYEEQDDASLEAVRESTIMLPIEVERTKQGLSLSITLNLNLNM